MRFGNDIQNNITNFAVIKYEYLYETCCFFYTFSISVSDM